MKTLSTISSNDIKACEVKADHAVERGEYEYALDLYEDALSLCPDNLPLRAKLRRTQIKAYSQQKDQAHRILSTTVLIARMRLKNNPREALESAERLMRTNPFNPKIIGALISAANKSAYPEVSQQALEILLEAEPNSDFMLNAMADLKHSKGDARGEYEYLSTLAKVRPSDSALNQRLKDVAARAALVQSAWEPEDSSNG